ncbi:DUF1801 domain-containing protein [Naasia sp. SYSU D00057]|uniref:DUF1801 domain-containing protein n=1 Tax=Naasia sp. SYSU D00057 TaxID=2817380 RepID=UPI0027DDED20|nr:DUF1801 domain-containing protein [Naasia sp. SYSU D00057]
MADSRDDEAPDEVRAFVDGVAHPVRRRDAETLLRLLTRITGQRPGLQGTIIGFGTYHYKYASGREGDAAAAAFSPRKAATTIYLPDGVGAHEKQLERLGPHTTGVGCLYLKDVSAVDLDVLESILEESYRSVASGVYVQRARDSEDGHRE